MEIPNLARTLVNQTKDEFRDQQKKAWDAERELILKYSNETAEDDYMRFVDQDLREQLPTPSNNITKRVTDRTSLVYKIPPI